MTTSTRVPWAALMLAGAIGATAARAQESCPCPPPAPAEPAWKGSLAAGLSASSGNTSTRNYNLGFDLAHDPKRRNVIKADGLYLRQQTDGTTTTDKTSAGLRDELKLGGHAFGFGELRYLRDPFKGVRYVLSPVGGLGYQVVATPRATLAFDGGLGGRFEGLAGQAGSSSGAVQAGQSLAAKLSEGATLTQRASGLWKMSDFGDALYRVELALALSLSKHLELKLADYFDYKTLPASAEIEKSDNSIVVALVFKIG